jgi:predicted nucleic acid-binding protein
VGLTILDAGILVAVLDPADAHHPASVAALRQAREQHDLLVVPASAYAECLVWPLRAGPAAVQRMDSFIDDLPATVAAADRGVARLGAGLRARYGPTLRLPDALVIATALALGADRILTTDAGWPRVDVAVEIVGGS